MQPQSPQPQQPVQPPQPSGAAPVPPQQPIGQQPAQGPQQPGPQAQTARNPNSAQNSLLFSELRDGMAVMNDGSFRAVVACQSINFDLMSDREREGIEFSYQSFLNSLYFPIQIFIRSQRVDIAPYIDKLAKMRREQDNMLLGVLMDDYINFIDIIAQETNIMDKSFFIVVPYYPGGDIGSAVKSSRSFFKALLKPDKQQRIVVNQKDYDKAKTEVQNRVGAVLNGLMQMGVQGVQLTTKELGSLYYNVYNPDTSLNEPLGDFSQANSIIVRKGEGQAPRPQGATQ